MMDEGTAVRVFFSFSRRGGGEFAKRVWFEDPCSVGKLEKIDVQDEFDRVATYKSVMKSR